MIVANKIKIFIYTGTSYTQVRHLHRYVIYTGMTSTQVRHLHVVKTNKLVKIVMLNVYRLYSVSSSKFAQSNNFGIQFDCRDR